MARCAHQQEHSQALFISELLWAGWKPTGLPLLHDINKYIADILLHQIQRTPLVNRTAGFPNQTGSGWTHHGPTQAPRAQQRQPFNLAEQSFGGQSVSGRSQSADEVENMLLAPNFTPNRRKVGNYQTSEWGMIAPQRTRPLQQQQQQRGVFFVASTA